MKAGMQEWQHIAATQDIALSITSLAAWRPAALWLTAGLTAYGVSLLAWLAVLVRYRLSYAYPLLGVAYVLVYVGATQWARLSEPVTTARTVGILLILAGVALVALTGDEASNSRRTPE
jgi:multidrug transporter EmrE-like cation transporter